MPAAQCGGLERQSGFQTCRKARLTRGDFPGGPWNYLPGVADRPPTSDRHAKVPGDPEGGQRPGQTSQGAGTWETA